MKLNWKTRGTFLMTGLLIDTLIVLILTAIFYNKIPWQQVGTSWAVLPVSLFVLDMIVFAIIQHFFPQVKKWWFDLPV